MQARPSGEPLGFGLCSGARVATLVVGLWLGALNSCGQATKGAWGMSWR